MPLFGTALNETQPSPSHFVTRAGNLFALLPPSASSGVLTTECIVYRYCRMGLPATFPRLEIGILTSPANHAMYAPASVRDVAAVAMTLSVGFQRIPRCMLRSYTPFGPPLKTLSIHIYLNWCNEFLASAGFCNAFSPVLDSHNHYKAPLRAGRTRNR